MKITKKEIEATSKLEANARYQYFMKRVADTEKMYSLVDEGGDWAIACFGEKTLFSVWSAPEFAQACAVSEWKGFSVKEFNIEDLESDIVDEIDTHEHLINVFSVKGKSGFIVDYNEFARDLSDEISKHF
ncbi:MAG: DUF2750 domain-containing protein [Chryseolinea sp.]